MKRLTPPFSPALFAAVTALVATSALASTIIPTVPIGNSGNPADTLVMGDGTWGYGSVAYAYNIGQTEVTNAQYTAFLNAVAASDPFGLDNPSMGSSQLGFRGGIARSGAPESYTYSTHSGREDHPVNFVSFWDACRFANWLHNGQGSGETETGAYTLTSSSINANTVTRNAGWRWAISSEDEWHKAAYHQPASAGGDADNYWLYPTSSNIEPTIANANIGRGDIPPDTSLVGSYAANFYGTFDMGGNLWEWNEAIFYGIARGIRGGSCSNSAEAMVAGFRAGEASYREEAWVGFRVVQVPEPSSVALLAIGRLLIARRRRDFAV